MEDVLELYARPHDPSEPVVALDERPVVLHDNARPDRSMRRGKPRRIDYEYVRRGTANISCIVEPKTGRHLTHATEDRIRPSFALAAERISRAYPHASRIHLVLNNLNTHTPASLIKAFGAERGRVLASRFEFHHTPKHASWLNAAEIEASLVSSECLGRNRIPTLAELRRRVRQWNAAADRARRTINGTFTVRDAERVFGSHWFNRIVSEH
ncbi:IS630 family transposase [Sorangium sp. So ce315]|uniref:IS630 family transposase n=1 Tax=Sorangium sp. So ce315 TaxID=3133299 RepID=UPI003F62F4AB